MIVYDSNQRASALKALAEHVRERADLEVSIVVTGPSIPNLTEKKHRHQLTEDLAQELDYLAEIITEAAPTFDGHVSPVLSKLHDLGITPNHLIINEVARALSEA
jgi:hypothetical protein